MSSVFKFSPSITLGGFHFFGRVAFVFSSTYKVELFSFRGCGLFEPYLRFVERFRSRPEIFRNGGRRQSGIAFYGSTRVQNHVSPGPP